MNDESPIVFDVDTTTAIEDWLERVLPMYAEECEGKIRADAYDLVRENVRERESLESALGSLPGVWRMRLLPDSRYLSKIEIRTIRRMAAICGKQPNIEGKLILTSILVAITIALAMALEPASLVEWMIYVFAIGFVSLPLVGLIWSTWIIRRAVALFGPFGCPASQALVAILLILPGGLLPWLLAISVVTFSLSGPTRIVFFTVGILIPFVAVLVLAYRWYFLFRARIRNNYELATELLGLPQFSIDESDG